MKAPTTPVRSIYRYEQNCCFSFAEQMQCIEHKRACLSLNGTHLVKYKENYQFNLCASLFCFRHLIPDAFKSGVTTTLSHPPSNYVYATRIRLVPFDTSPFCNCKYFWLGYLICDQSLLCLVFYVVRFFHCSLQSYSNLFLSFSFCLSNEMNK